MLLDGRIISDGDGIIAYLDQEMFNAQQKNLMVTAIVIGTRARLHLTAACQRVMQQLSKPDTTVNRYRGALLIEDGRSPDRVEVIAGEAPTMPVVDDVFRRGLKPI